MLAKIAFDTEEESCTCKKWTCPICAENKKKEINRRMKSR